MNIRSNIFAFMLFSTQFAVLPPAVAGLLFRDDFEDGGATDGTPVTWTSGLGHWEPTTAEVKSGDYLIRSSSIDLPFPGEQGIYEAHSFVEGIVAKSVTVRTQARCAEGVACYVGVASRYAYLESGTDGGILHAEIVQEGEFLELFMGIYFGSSDRTLRRVPTSLNVSETDIILELNTYKDSANFFAWAAGTDKPATPQISVRTLTQNVPDEGSIAVFYANRDPQLDPAAFRYVEVGPSVAGDFDLNGELNVADIDALSLAVRSGENKSLYDIDDDAIVTSEDRRVWVKDLKHTWFGDANLDLQFDSADLVEVLAAGKYEVDEQALWSSGDFDGSGRFDSGDLVSALADGGYEKGPRAATATVPEPSAVGLVAVGGLLFMRRHGREVFRPR